MKTIPLSLTLGLLAFVFTIALRADEPPALKIKGTNLVDEKGAAIQLRGVNLGCWLLLEPHFLGMSFRDDKSLWAGLERRVGKAKTEEIHAAFQDAWITADDFKNVKKLGLNHVRVPFPYTRKLDLPDFEKDDADTILKKIRTQMSAEHFELYEPVANALAAK